MALAGNDGGNWWWAVVRGSGRASKVVMLLNFGAGKGSYKRRWQEVEGDHGVWLYYKGSVDRKIWKHVSKWGTGKSYCYTFLFFFILEINFLVTH